MKKIKTHLWLKLESLNNRKERRKEFFSKNNNRRQWRGFSRQEVNNTLSHKKPFISFK